MPQVVDFESLVCCGDGGKVSCETLAPDAPSETEDPASSRPPQQVDDPDLPADSFRLPLTDVLDWISRNSAAAPYDRDESTRGGAHPKSSAPHHHKHSGGSGQLRYGKPAKGPIIGLPNKIRSSGYLGQSARRHAAYGRFFPAKKGGGDGSSVGSGRTSVTTTTTTLEPTSPKVSCLGRVLADQDPMSRRRRPPSTAQGSVSLESSSSVSAAAPTGGTTGLWGALCWGLSCCGQQRDAALLGEEESASTTSGASHAAAAAATPSKGKVDAPPLQAPTTTVMAPPLPGLGCMRRLASGRRAASWSGNLELELQVLEDAAGSGPTPPQQYGELQGILRGRRSAGSLADLVDDGDRGSEGAGGSASV